MDPIRETIARSSMHVVAQFRLDAEAIIQKYY